jgi:hypothetical protein
LKKASRTFQNIEFMNNKPIPFDIVLDVLSRLDYKQLYEIQKSSCIILAMYASIALKTNVRKGTLVERNKTCSDPVRRINITIETRPFGPSPVLSANGRIQIQTRKLVCESIGETFLDFSPFQEVDAAQRGAVSVPIQVARADIAWLILKIDIPSIGKVSFSLSIMK